MCFADHVVEGCAVEVQVEVGCVPRWAARMKADAVHVAKWNWEHSGLGCCC